MRKTLGIFYENVSSKSEFMLFGKSEIELMSDEAAQEVRGGDKDYSPIYEDDSALNSKWFFPSILLST
jgi:hypothetical protein